MKTRLLFVTLSASVFFASWGAAASRFLAGSRGQLSSRPSLDSPRAPRRGQSV